MVYDHPFFCFMLLQKYPIKIIIVCLALCVIFIAYWPGLAGGFIFDDYYSLQKLAILKGDLSFANIWTYLMASDTGPLKRPISVLSFILNAQNWPVEQAFWFKLTNVIIHALNSLLLFILLTSIFKQHKQWHQSAFILSISAAMLWALNPYLVSTVLYVVQRMAMLPLTFGLLMLILYFYRRLSYQPLDSSYRWLLVTGGMNGLLLFCATLSKENGILFVYLLALFEVLICHRFLALQALSRRDYFWLFKLPVIILTVLVLLKTPDFVRGYDIREFSLYERLLSEFRVVSLYLKSFFVPGIFSQGVFVDGFVKSTGLFSPITTITSLIFVVCLVMLTVLLRHRFVWFSFAFGFFFISQLLESTWVPLELIFEHRVYMASVFLPVPLVFMMHSVIKNHSIQISIMLLLLLILALMTYQKTKIWGNELQLHLTTTKTYPESTRAAVMSADLLARQERNDLAMQILIRATEHNQALQLKYNLFILKCDMGLNVKSEFEELVRATQQDTFTKDDYVSIHYVIEKVLLGACNLQQPISNALRLVDALKFNSFYDNLYGQKLITALELFVKIESNNQRGAVKVYSKLLQLHEEPVNSLIYIEKLIEQNKLDLAEQFYYLFIGYYLVNKKAEDYGFELQNKLKKIQSELSLHESSYQ